MPTKPYGKQSGHHNTSSREKLTSPERQLRQQAEARLFEWEKLLPAPLDLESSRRLLRELRVHQVELEIQNEELRRFQEELEESRNRYKNLYNFAPVGYLTIDAAGLIVEANLTAAALLGVEGGTVVGQPITRFIFPDDQDVYHHHRAAILETNERRSCKLLMLRNNHQSFWARLETVPVGENGPGPPTCWIMLSDIDRGMRLAEEARHLESRSRQQQKTESLECMAGAIAHYFNNQLTIVMGNLDLAVKYLPRDTESREFILSAIDGAKKAAEMSGSMLTYLGQTNSSHEPVDLAATCRDVLETLRPFIPKTTSLAADLPTDGLIINANAGQIGQVVDNLVTNAWESQRGSEGTVEVRIEAVKSVDIPETHRFPVDWQVCESVYACLEVADTGCGLDATEIDRIFDPFYSSKFVGRGLGLPLVIGIVRSHNGGVTVVGKKDKGSVFKVFLPVYREKWASSSAVFPEKRVSRTGGSAEEATILVVNDEPTLRLIAEAALHRVGCKVLVAADGEEAVEIFKQHPVTIDCVLCDFIMPGMDGWQTLAALRRLDPGIVFILSSGYSQDRAMAGDHVALPQSFLGNPYGFGELQ
ncbi:hybrid sensor histidine kinase/response regulator [Desulfogranum japonicum]|uniref:hybrid sensor histidine kinase/response regulator n=1 Tax=Desulfogranum japonicum TaxID=231447 RepID=UPI000404B602|nr:ATP-binding protein [Desulfogranum japonicum]